MPAGWRLRPSSCRENHRRRSGPPAGRLASRTCRRARPRRVRGRASSTFRPRTRAEDEFRVSNAGQVRLQDLEHIRPDLVEPGVEPGPLSRRVNPRPRHDADHGTIATTLGERAVIGRANTAANSSSVESGASALTAGGRDRAVIRIVARSGIDPPGTVSPVRRQVRPDPSGRIPGPEGELARRQRLE